MYVLVYKSKGASDKFFTGQNLYLGTAEVATDIDSAENMSLEEAVRKYELMKNKDKWHIHPIIFVKGLGEEYVDHITKSRIKDLKDQLKKEEEKLK